MHLSMLTRGEGGVGLGVVHDVEILTFSLKKKIQIPHPWDNIIGQNSHPEACEGAQMSVKPTLGASRTIKTLKLSSDFTIKFPWLALPTRA